MNKVYALISEYIYVTRSTDPYEMSDVYDEGYSVEGIFSTYEKALHTVLNIPLDDEFEKDEIVRVKDLDNYEGTADPETFVRRTFQNEDDYGSWQSECLEKTYSIVEVEMDKYGDITG